MHEPNEILNENLPDKPAETPNQKPTDNPAETSLDNSSDPPPTAENLLLAAVELKAALDDFRKTVLNALEQKRFRNHIREPVWLNSREAQQMLKICSRTLYRYRQQNLIGFRVIHKNYLYRYSEIVSFIENKSNCI